MRRLRMVLDRTKRRPRSPLGTAIRIRGSACGVVQVQRQMAGTTMHQATPVIPWQVTECTMSFAGAGWPVFRVYPYDHHEWVALGWAEMIRELSSKGCLDTSEGGGNP